MAGRRKSRPSTIGWWRSRRRRKPVQRGGPITRLDRYTVHLIVLAVGSALAAHNPLPLLPVIVVGLIASAAALLAKDGVRAAIAFRIRSRSRIWSYDVSVRVKASTWDSTAFARVLTILSVLLPPEYRSDYVEEQCANLLAADDNQEWFEYLLDLVLELPRVAWQFYSERKRESAR